MRRSRLILTLTLYFVAISIAGPAAFQIGKAAGRSLRVDAFPGPFVVAGPADASGGVADFFDCDGRIRLPALRQFDRIQDCRPEGLGGRGWTKAAAGAERRLAPRRSALARSLIRSIAEGPRAGAAGPSDSKLLISDAGAAAGGRPSGSLALTAPGGGFSGPSFPGGGGLPGNLIAAIDQDEFGEPPSFDPGPGISTAAPEVPAPPALILVATGAAALRLASRRRAKAPKG